MSPRTTPALRQDGLTLVELTLVLGVATTALAFAIWSALRSADARATVREEQARIHEVAARVQSSWGIIGGFGGLSSGRYLADGLTTRPLETRWGSPIVLSPHSLMRANDAFTIQYPETPAGVCVDLGAAVRGGSLVDVQVSGLSVYAPGQGVDISALSDLCFEGATMTFVFAGVGGTAVAANPVVLPPAVPPGFAPPQPEVPVTPPSGTTPAPAPVPVITPPPVIAPPPAAPTEPPMPPPSAPVPGDPEEREPDDPIPPSPGYPPSCFSFAPTPTLETRSTACAAGQFGTVLEERETEYLCLDADGEEWGWAPSYTPVPGPWQVIDSTCAPCPSGGVETALSWLPMTQACPSGWSGSHAWEEEHQRERSTSYNCPAGTTTLPPVSEGPWSPWVSTGARRSESNTCAAPPPVCSPAPPPTTSTRSHNGCPAGTYGSWLQSQTTGWVAAPHPTCWTIGAPGPWTPTTAPPTACAPCPASSATTEIRWVARSAACPSGQGGSNTWEAQQTRSRTASYVCPVGTTALPPASFTPWSSWSDTGLTRNTVNTCAPTGPAAGSWRVLGDSIGPEDCQGRYGETWLSPGPNGGGQCFPGAGFRTVCDGDAAPFHNEQITVGYMKGPFATIPANWYPPGVSCYVGDSVLYVLVCDNGPSGGGLAGSVEAICE